MKLPTMEKGYMVARTINVRCVRNEHKQHDLGETISLTESIENKKLRNMPKL